MQDFEFLRPASVDEALQYSRAHPEARLLAGGQSLLAAMRLGLSAPTRQQAQCPSRRPPL